MSDCTPVNGRELTVESNEDCNDIIIEKENLVNKSTNLKEKAYKVSNSPPISYISSN